VTIHGTHNGMKVSLCKDARTTPGNTTAAHYKVRILTPAFECTGHKLLRATFSSTTQKQGK